MILYHAEPGSPVIEISVEGKITDHDLREAIERMRGDLELNGKTRVLERIEHFTGIDPKALWTDITLGVSVARKVTRAAVVADAGWIRASMHLARFFTKAEVKAFHVNELEQARIWINT
ncbi:STAS/SEC14 domain-containing protein [Paraburkholderia sp. BL17N1]|uniref:STAS/SEC14 domain-containing protein n=1 Tax=Paraburkholderia sp. BL17N1 TaxID=1938798 RepID=UPI000EB1AD71|nr:STAS/SEC14 domain-containing protein [Paraburkholderia sp. BL17N1]RKR31683.1 SpoIIAA-like protein [Paraburkholderia sp. BL17N1]